MGMVQYKDYNSFEDWIPGGHCHVKCSNLDLVISV